MIGRIAVLKSQRKSGLGAKIVSAAEDIIRQNGGNKSFIHAQMQAVPFYEKIGFETVGKWAVRRS